MGIASKFNVLHVFNEVELTIAGLPTLWGFLEFNYTEREGRQHVLEERSSIELVKAEWKYPEDYFYIKMFILCPRSELEKAFGERHAFGDKKRRYFYCE